MCCMSGHEASEHLQSCSQSAGCLKQVQDQSIGKATACRLWTKTMYNLQKGILVFLVTSYARAIQLKLEHPAHQRCGVQASKIEAR